jgi:hypothetical protein
MQSLAKDLIQDSIREINQQKWEWPYHAIQHTQTLVVGQTEYAWPSDFKSVDWNTFQIQKDPTLNVNNTSLQVIDRVEWYKYQRDLDDDNSISGQRVPMMVFKSHGNGFGISPSPDKTYTIEFRYYRNEGTLVNSTDTTDIPSQFDNVITAGALYHMNLFRENLEGATTAQNSFTAGIKNMYITLVGEVSPYASSTVVNQGGSPFWGYWSENYHT